MKVKLDVVLAKTAKGLSAAKGYGGISVSANALLCGIDGQTNLATLAKRLTGLPAFRVDEAASELLGGGYAQSLGAPAAFTPTPDSSSLLGSLDFTRMRATQKLRQAADIARAREAQRAEDERRKEQIETARAAAEQKRIESEARAAQAGLEGEVRGMLVKVLRPRVEEALRTRLAAVLKPRIEEDLHRRLVAALRPKIEAELKPRVELELRARFARQLADQSARSADRSEVCDAPPRAAVEGARAAALLACLGEAVFSTDALGVLTQVNPAWCRLAGRAEADCVGRALAAFFGNQARPGVEEFLGRIAHATAIRFDHHAELETSDGALVWVELHATPLSPDEGGTVGTCGVMREFGEARRLAADLQVTSLQLLLLVDESDAGILVEDANGAIRQVNPAFCSLFDVQAAPFSYEGAGVAELMHDVGAKLSDLEALLARMAELRASGEDSDAEQYALEAGGTFDMSYRAVADDGPPRGHLWLFRLPLSRTLKENRA